MRVVIAAESGRLREGLQTMLASIVDLDVVAVVEDSPSALEVIESQRPDLVIVDASLSGQDIAEFVRTMRRAWNGVRCLAVADRLGQFQPLLDAGADRVLLKGFSAAELAEAIKQLSNNVTDRELPATGR
jgi:DNA-binding NarL/FixJ family response regulator